MVEGGGGISLNLFNKEKNNFFARGDFKGADSSKIFIYSIVSFQVFKKKISIHYFPDWFPGWSQQGFYNRQPNDDGFSHQDCVEIRRIFPHPLGSRIVDGLTQSYLWNDLDCNAKNFFLCERLESGGKWTRQKNSELWLIKLKAFKWGQRG